MPPRVPGNVVKFLNGRLVNYVGYPAAYMWQGYAMDRMAHDGKGFIERWQNGNLTQQEKDNFAMNMLFSGLGSLAHAGVHNINSKWTPLLSPVIGEGIVGVTLPLKMNSVANKQIADSTERLNASYAARADQEKENLKLQNDVSKVNLQAAQTSAQAAKYMPLVAGTIGAGGLLLAGLGIGKYLMSKPPKQKGTIRLKMPGKKGDPESTAEVELPLNMPKMSPSLVEGLDRAVRLRTRKNIRANSYKKDPETGKLIPYDDWEEKYGKDGEKIKNPSTDNPLASMFKDDSGSGLPKAATAIEFSEGLGTAANTVALYHLGKLLGPLLNNATRGVVSGRTADMTGGLLAALLPAIGGHVAGKLMPARTAAEQTIYDSQNNGILNYTVPGYAMYQAARRSKAKAMNGAAAKGGDSDDYDDDDDWDKEASAVPQQQPQQPQDPNQQQAQPTIDYSIFKGQYVPVTINKPSVGIPQDGNTQTTTKDMQAIQFKLNNIV